MTNWKMLTTLALFAISASCSERGGNREFDGRWKLDVDHAMKRIEPISVLTAQQVETLRAQFSDKEWVIRNGTMEFSSGKKNWKKRLEYFENEKGNAAFRIVDADEGFDGFEYSLLSTKGRSAVIRTRKNSMELDGIEIWQRQ